MNSALTLGLTLLAATVPGFVHSLDPEPACSDLDLPTLFELEGAWIGALGYRDYQSDEWVTLPIDVSLERSPDGGFLVGHTVFDEGEWTLRTMDVRGIDATTDELVTVSFGRQGIETTRQRAAELVRDGEDGWKATFLSGGHDDGREARIRETLHLAGDTFVQRKEICFVDGSGEEWLRRSEVSLRRGVRAPEAGALAGSWKVDLRPTPDSPPYTTGLVLEHRDGEYAGTFYGTALEEVRGNEAWGAAHLAFVTRDGTGTYHTSLRLSGDVLEGTTHSLGREFLSVWTAERE